MATHLSVDELERRYRAAHEPHERTWWQILWLLARGQTATAIAESTGYTRYWTLANRQTLQRRRAGRDAEQTAHHLVACAAHALGRACREELRQALAGEAPEGAKRWTCRAVADWIADKLGRPVQVQRGWDYLQRLKQSQQVPRPRHALADGEQQAAIKKN